MTLGRSSLPIEIQKLIIAFSSLPGIGPKTAQRLTFYVLSQNTDETLKLSDALEIMPLAALKYNLPPPLLLYA